MRPRATRAPLEAAFRSKFGFHVDAGTALIRKREDFEARIDLGDLLEPFSARPARFHWIHVTLEEGREGRGVAGG